MKFGEQVPDIVLVRTAQDKRRLGRRLRR